MKFDHTSLIIKFSEKVSKDADMGDFQGIDEKSRTTIKEMGNNGWEMVSVLPFSAGAFSASGAGIFSASQSQASAAIVFFKKSIQ